LLRGCGFRFIRVGLGNEQGTRIRIPGCRKAAALQQRLQGLAGRGGALYTRRLHAAQLVRMVDKLGSGLAGKGIQRAGKVASRHVDGAADGLRLRSQCNRTSQTQQQAIDGSTHDVSPPVQKNSRM
jgi:hypothetical protein